MLDDEKFGMALDYLAPKTTKMIQDFIKATENLALSEEEKSLLQALAVETLLYNTNMDNQTLRAVLRELSTNIRTGHSYSNDALNWRTRSELFKVIRKLDRRKKTN